MEIKNRGGEVKKEVLLSLLIILIFLTIVGTWIVIEAIDNYKLSLGTNMQPNVVYEPADSFRGASVGIKVMPKEDGGDANG